MNTKPTDKLRAGLAAILRTDSDGKPIRTAFYIVFFISAVAMTLLAATHELWRDEYQAWLIARDLSPAGIIYNARYEGHPVLWHFLLMPFAKLNFPHATMLVISIVFALAGNWILLFKTKLCAIFKVMLSVSPFVVYYFAAFGRPYSLCYFLVCLLMALYPQREKHLFLYNVIIFLALQTHVYLSGLCGGLMLIDAAAFFKSLRTKDGTSLKRFLALMISTVGVALLVLTLLSTFSANGEVKPKTEIRDLLYVAITSRLPVLGHCLHVARSWMVYYFLNAVLALYAVAAFVILLEYPKAMTVFLCGAGFFTAIIAFIYPATKQKAPTLFYALAMTCIVWNGETKRRIVKEKKPENAKKDISFNFTTITCVLLSIMLIISVSGDFGCLAYDFTENFADGEATAEIVNETVPKGETIYCVGDFYCVPVAACASDNSYYDIVSGTSFTFTKWTNEHALAYDEFNERARCHLLLPEPEEPLFDVVNELLEKNGAPSEGTLYLLVAGEYLRSADASDLPSNYTVLYQTEITERDKTYRNWGEGYYLYSIQL